MKLRTLFHTAALCMLAATVGGARAQDAWPAQQVRLIVPWAAGGTVDFTARQLAQKLGELTGKAFIVDNKAGGSGTIGSGYVAKAPPDGSTVLVFDASYASIPALFSKLTWDQANDLVPVATVITTPMALVVSNSSPFKTTQDLIDYAKANPGKLNFGSGGIGSTPHLAAEIFKRQAGVDMTHIPYKGGGEALMAVMSGAADVLFTATATAMPQFNGGRVRILAITGSHRLPAMPNVPTVGETVQGYYFDNWYGVALPKGSSPALVAQLNGLIGRALEDPGLRERLVAQGAEIHFSRPEVFGKLMHDETVRYTEVSRAAGIRPE